MGLMELASGNSLWRGFDYYEGHKVKSWEKVDETVYNGVVNGSNGTKYKVCIDTAHPRKSSCNCPFADGRRVICKHMIALLFTVQPEALQKFHRDVEEAEEESKREAEEHEADLWDYVKRLSKAELQSALFNALLELEERDRW